MPRRIAGGVRSARDVDCRDQARALSMDFTWGISCGRRCKNVRRVARMQLAFMNIPL
jgi:hypothetical protein